MTTDANFFRSLLHHNDRDVFSLVFAKDGDSCKRYIGYLKEIKKADGTATDVVFEVLDQETGAVHDRGWHDAGRSTVFPEVEFLGRLRDDPAWASLVRQIQNKNALYDVLKSFGLQVPCPR